MPIYEYRCEQGHTFEVMQRMTDEPVSKCEVCGAPVQRVFHPIAVHFKGSGFYNTDYGTRKRSREKEAAESAGKKSEAKKDGASPDSGSKSGGEKPAAKAETSSGGDKKPGSSSKN